jgi:2'-5' RNA ligase
MKSTDEIPLNEYLIILTPPEDIYEHVMKVKKLFKNQYGITDAPNSYPHITLSNFCQYESWENQIIKTLKIAIY